MLLSTSAAYRLWAPYYDMSPNPVLAVEERMFGDLFPDLHFQRVIDVGCGTGRSLLRYRDRGALAFGADPCPEMLAEAARKPGLRTKVVQAEAAHLPFADQIADMTVCSFALSYFDDVPRAVDELARVTKSKGQIVISDLHPVAVANGWTRSFRVGENAYEIAHSPCRDEDLQSAFKNAGLQIVTQKEAGFADPERSIFAAAAKEHVYWTLIGKPAVRVIVCKKV